MKRSRFMLLLLASAVPMLAIASNDEDILRNDRQRLLKLLGQGTWSEVIDWLILPKSAAGIEMIRRDFERDVKSARIYGPTLVGEEIGQVSIEKYQQYLVASLGVKRAYKNPMHKNGLVTVDENFFALKRENDKNWKFSAAQCLTKEGLIGLIS
jgi:hypothetical protein